jgi:hypothetical protein
VLFGKRTIEFVFFMFYELLTMFCCVIFSGRPTGELELAGGMFEGMEREDNVVGMAWRFVEFGEGLVGASLVLMNEELMKFLGRLEEDSEMFLEV